LTLMFSVDAARQRCAISMQYGVVGDYPSGVAPKSGWAATLVSNWLPVHGASTRVARRPAGSVPSPRLSGVLAGRYFHAGPLAGFFCFLRGVV